jgi:hypothetical protein
MRTELREKWYTFISNDDSITAEWLYILLNPTDRKKYFEIVGVIVTRHKTQDPEYGYTIADEQQSTWTSSYIMDFKLTAVEYLIEFEKDQSSNNQIYIPTTSPVVYPSYPTVPNVPGTTDPYPWQLPQVWCANIPATNQYFCTTTSTH